MIPTQVGLINFSWSCQHDLHGDGSVDMDAQCYDFNHSTLRTSHPYWFTVRQTILAVWLETRIISQYVTCEVFSDINCNIITRSFYFTNQDNVGIISSKYHKRLFATELIFCNNPKSNGKIPLSFVEGTRAMLTSGLAYKNMSSLQHTAIGVEIYF